MTASGSPPGEPSAAPRLTARNLPLATRVGLGLTLLLLLAAGLAGWQLIQIERLHEANRMLAEAELEVSRSSLRMRLVVDRLTNLTQRYFVIRDPGYRGRLDRVRALGAEELGRLAGLPIAPAEIEPTRDRWAAYLERSAEIEPAVPEGGAGERERDRLVETLAEVRAALVALDAEAVERVSRRIEVSTARAAAARRAALLAVSVGLLGALLLAVWVHRSTVRPLRSLAQAAHAIADGDFHPRVPAEGPAEIVSLARDFERMATRLGEVDEMKRQFLSSVSHDLKAPLASMQETGRLLLDEAPLEGAHRRLLELNLQGAQRLQQMIGDLLEVARLEAGAVELEPETLDLSGCCRQVVDEAAGLLEAGGITVEVEAPPGSLPVRADPRLLAKAVWNLLSNAIKFSPEGGQIRFRLWRVDDPSELPPAIRPGTDRVALPAAALAVADRGPGIADEEKPHIFERFYRSRRHERYASGTGLGLAITRSIVEQHGGEIRVEDHAGGGSLFTVLLPAPNDEGQSV